jgi:hypothetical protein
MTKNLKGALVFGVGLAIGVAIGNGLLNKVKSTLAG